MISHSGPSINRTTMVELTPAILAVHTSWRVNFKSDRINGTNGFILNQIMNAVKKHKVDQWNALMCGRANENMSISTDLSPSFLTISTWYCLYFFHFDCQFSYMMLQRKQKRRRERQRSVRRWNIKLLWLFYHLSTTSRIFTRTSKLLLFNLYLSLFGRYIRAWINIRSADIITVINLIVAINWNNAFFQQI